MPTSQLSPEAAHVAPPTTQAAGQAGALPWNLMDQLSGDTEMVAVFGPQATVDAWLRIEAELSRAQALLEIIPSGAGAAIEEICRNGSFDKEELWASARNVGYPIFGLVRQIDARLPEEHRGYAHLGATTQDIMDTGLALQVSQACDVLLERFITIGNALEDIALRERSTVMAARTHGQQAVPTTLGAKFAVYLGEFGRHVGRLRCAREEVRWLSLHGAGGTSAAFGPEISELRRIIAARLDFRTEDMPWHVARDRFTMVLNCTASAATTSARLGREVANLSRTEIAELSECIGHHRGASSTMPQKRNPIAAEVAIGYATFAASMASGIYRSAEHEHERATGEWQLEWLVLPTLLCAVSGAMLATVRMLDGLEIFGDRMAHNLQADDGLLMAEAMMIRLAPEFGREVAHDLVYEASERARAEGCDLGSALNLIIEGKGIDLPIGIRAADYLGQAASFPEAAAHEWRMIRDGQDMDGA